MSDFFNEIKDSVENFAQPVKQSLKNLKNIPEYISDTIKDSADEKVEKKGCISKFIPVIIICLIIGFISNQCSDDNVSNLNSDSTSQISSSETLGEVVDEVESNIVSTEDDSKIYTEHLRYQIEYADKYDIKINRFPKLEKALAECLETVDETEIYLDYEKGIGKNFYKRTEKLGDYVYFGELKDNKPNGYGALFKRSDINYGAMMLGDEIYFNRYYIGNFKNGKIDGFGLLFDVIESSIDELSSRGIEFDSNEFYNLYLDWGNPVGYFGMFSNGEIDGLGNYFHVFSLENLEKDYNLNELNYPIVETGEFSGEYLNGKGRFYWGGYLQYDGELKNGTMHGYGKRYYFLSEVLEYEGEFKNDKRHGYGISYSKDGEVLYDGNWENDDYK